MAEHNLLQKDFSGGITDFYRNTVPNKLRICDNLVVGVNNNIETRPGSEFYDSTHKSATGLRCNSIIDFDDLLTTNIWRNLYYYRNGNWVQQTGPTGNNVFESGDVNSQIAYDICQNQLILTSDSYSHPIRFYNVVGDTFKATTIGLPTFISIPTVAGVAGSNSYLYYFVFYYKYTSLSTTYETFGNPIFTQVTSVDAPNTNAITITDIQSLGNGAIDNYDVDNVKVRIYRTENNGVAPYLVAELDNGIDVYVDTTSDADLILSTLLYTYGGAVEHTLPPKCKYLTVTGVIGWYANIYGYPFRLMQSVPNAINGVPADFYVDIKEEITGINHIESTPILFAKDKTYRIEGTRTTDGSGLVRAKSISDTVGCVSNNSIVRGKNSLYFAGNDGFYVTDGFNVQKLTLDLPERYYEIIKTEDQQKRIQGTRDPFNERIIWIVTSDDSGRENDTWWILNQRTGGFTTASGSKDFPTSFYSSAIGYFDNKIMRSDNVGNIYKHSNDYLTDPMQYTINSVTYWHKRHIPIDLETICYDYGDASIIKLMKYATLILGKESSLDLQMYSIKNDSMLKKAFSIMRESLNEWGDPLMIWGAESPPWAQEGYNRKKRHFPRNGTRVKTTQLKITIPQTILQTSESTKTAVIATAGGITTVTLPITPPTSDYRFNMDGLYQYFYSKFDNYVAAWQIYEINDNVMKIYHPSATITDGTYKWKMVGYKRNQKFNLYGIAQSFNIGQNKGDEYKTNESGALLVP